jgi:hypothetical protein
MTINAGRLRRVVVSEFSKCSQVPAGGLFVHTGTATRDQSLQLLLHGQAVLTLLDAHSTSLAAAGGIFHMYCKQTA